MLKSKSSIASFLKYTICTFTVFITLGLQAFADNPFETALQAHGPTKSSQILSSTYSSNDGNPNPFNPIVTNIQQGKHNAEFYAFTTTNVNGWTIKVTKAYYGLSDVAYANGFGWYNPTTGAYQQMIANGAPSGTTATWTPGNVSIFPVCVTGSLRYSWQSYSQYLPMIVTAKGAVSSSSAKYYVFCEDTPGGDYDWNDHGYVIDVTASQCADGLDNDGDGLIDLADPGCSNLQDNNESDGTSQCQDGIDNDGDGATDFPADFSCSSKQDNDETNPKAQCQDGMDNDGDGLIDLIDPGCSSSQDNNESDGTSQCQDGIDNDGDGAKDFPADFSCSSPQDNDETNPKAQCQDGIDNDGDGLKDLADPGCANSQDNNESDATTQCQDGIDNDGDGARDYPADFSCSSPTDNDETNPKAQCQDGADNDGDGLIDLIDPGCSSPQDNNESDGTSQCQDGIDNDGDGAKDFPADYSCSSPQDNDETNPKSQCQDGFDNDSDGLIDLIDPGCSNPQDNNEGDATSQCQDGIDNDGDGAKDFPADYSCSSPQDNDETNPKSQCQDAKDNDGDGLVDLLDPGCSGPQDNYEGDGTSQCQDLIDNDGDGATDYPNDFSCTSPQDNDESNPKNKCRDGIDNDGDGLIDALDPGCTSSQDDDESNPVANCTDASTTSIKTDIDAAAAQLANLTKQAANQLAKNAKKILRGADLKSTQVDASRAKTKADRFAKRVQELLIGVPEVIKLCPNAAATCKSVDRTEVLNQLKSLYTIQLSSIKRIVARSYFNAKGSTLMTRTDPIVLTAKKVFVVGNAAIAAVPPIETVCK